MVDCGSGQFYRARYYSPTFGRFISEDPAGFNGGINLYEYTGDNPISFTDPFGTDKKQRQRMRLDSRPECDSIRPTDTQQKCGIHAIQFLNWAWNCLVAKRDCRRLRQHLCGTCGC
jgi:uncharacterized protein RhaS with RHS repeats